ncbi:hypothetical protein DQQ10_12565 [Pseudochryseolinea flava]|uniref:Galactose oxidase n=2 Tax=Pseudochryseolinea flava TaxID=2059302 RepID=A0A364Y5G5_9BACT|nr:hypothetical protein DQQ10_12565 [Pseudochryseolinea flava]
MMMSSCVDNLDIALRDSESLKTESDVNASPAPDNLNTPIILPPYSWNRLTPPVITTYPFNFASNNNSIYEIGGEIYCAIGGMQEVFYKLNQTTMQWELFNDQYNVATTLAINTYLFSYQGKVYYASYQSDSMNECTAIDPVTGQTRNVQKFPGIVARDMITFNIGIKGYVMGGSHQGKALNQFWEYDFFLNQWKNKGALPGGPRAGATAKVIGNTVYYGLGYHLDFVNGLVVKRFHNDWISLVPSTNVATTKAPFPDYARYYAKGFVINSKVYLGWGVAFYVSGVMDFWEYNPATNVWTKKGNYGPVLNENDHNIGAFALGNNGYIVKGNLNEFWRYSRFLKLPQ